MACELLTEGIPKDCTTPAGGVRKIYITDFTNVSGVTVDGDQVITAFTMAGSPVSVFYEFSFTRNSAEFQDNGTPNVENGSLFYDQTVTLIIPRRETTKRNTLALLMQKDLAVIVLDSNGIYWYAGQTNGMYVSTLPSTSGKLKGDANGYTITLKAEEPEQAREVEAAAVAAVI